MILDSYQYLYDVIKTSITTIKSPNVLATQIHTFNINLIGSRLSAKTIQVLKFLIEFGIIAKNESINVATAIIRYEPKGASETFDELLSVAEDLYEIPTNRKNTNMTKRMLNIGNNDIRALGLTSNRKRKVPKLGLARKGIKKDIQVNLFEEITEIPNEKTTRIVRQATGGAKIVININIANPWILSMWYVKKVNRILPFNAKKLREQGQQYKSSINKAKKTMDITHITNHRINTYLNEAQHQELYDLWDIDEQLANVADLGMPGVAEGLVYAPTLYKVLPPTQNMRVLEFSGGLDWGTSTNANGSATALVLGRKAKNYKFITIDNEYFHSNSKQFYKDDETLLNEIVNTIIEYYKEWREDIISTGGYITIYYDYAAATLGRALEQVLNIHKDQAIAKKIIIKPCVKYDVPIRIDIVKHLISQGRYKVNKKMCVNHWEELEGAMYDDTRKVKGRPTRLNEDDHTLDAMEYFIGADLYNFADSRYTKYNKLI